MIDFPPGWQHNCNEHAEYTRARSGAEVHIQVTDEMSCINRAMLGDLSIKEDRGEGLAGEGLPCS